MVERLFRDDFEVPQIREQARVAMHALGQEIRFD